MSDDFQAQIDRVDRLEGLVSEQNEILRDCQAALRLIADLLEPHFASARKMAPFEA